MSNAAPQGWAWQYSPAHDPFHPLRPGHFPVPQSVAPVHDRFHAPVHAPHAHAPPMPSLGMPQGNQPQVVAPHQGPARVQAQQPNVPPAPPQTYDQRQAPEHLPPTNGNPPGQGGPGFPARQAVPSLRNPPAGPQTTAQAHAANGSPSNQYLPPTGYAPAGPQAQGYVANSNHPTQYVQVNTSPATHPQLYQGMPAYSVAPQATQWASQHPPATPVHPHSPINMDRNPSQGMGMGMGGDGQSSDQTYAHIISNNLLPEGYRPTACQRVGRPHQRTGPNFNDGSSPLYTTPANASYQAPRQGPPHRPGPQYTSKFDLPPSRPMPPQLGDNGRIAATQPRPINGEMPQPGRMPHSDNTQHPNSMLHNNMPPQSNVYPASNTPRSNMHHLATHQPDIKRNAKRPAGQPPRKQPAKRQKKSEPTPVAPAQQLPEPVADANAVIPQPVADAVAVIPDQHASPDELQTVEPPHLPPIELENIKTQFVVDPGPETPILPGKTVISWDAAIEEVMNIIRNCEEGSAVRLEPLARLRELGDAIELFIAHPGRRELLVYELDQLLDVRYIRVIEDGIWNEEFSTIPVRNHDILPAETKERVVAEAWEKRRREWPGPSPQEVERQIYKYDRLDLLGLSSRQFEPDPEE